MTVERFTSEQMYCSAASPTSPASGASLTPNSASPTGVAG